ncbi:MAG: hypothetical protein AUJ28_03360 [Parcubacteria group bacterium CG1_02_37_51]|uniref:Uncharacterized protein n=2 Tax=Candidatus Komeiliibacteriota TaxID=1817908 RepID=A0A2M8DPV2_9BACT|nr:MAG: hypothetical protein AUJ28_03360 [Parcubacteria group bacterium CG1_02_37_51]PIY94292.1 MAG: hypothetical protein COY67_02705 [Candidatus Komeilibacteria bacterium CG_4_10_14_0_8_um_filter_37_78]PJC00962.1 MAG: hypothetical protein CO073_04800 [Candidatus Komeilibacteria bacterium CG_4_9_14_0_8_um_filter_36_9]
MNTTKNELARIKESILAIKALSSEELGKKHQSLAKALKELALSVKSDRIEAAEADLERARQTFSQGSLKSTEDLFNEDRKRYCLNDLKMVFARIELFDEDKPVMVEVGTSSGTIILKSLVDPDHDWFVRHVTVPIIELDGLPKQDAIFLSQLGDIRLVVEIIENVVAKNNEILNLQKRIPDLQDSVGREESRLVELGVDMNDLDPAASLPPIL